MSLVKSVLKIAAVAGAAYGAYYIYKNYIKKPDTTPEFDDTSVAGLGYDEDAAKEESFADKIKAAAERQLDKLK